MSQGIVRVTPRPGVLGQLQITIADSNPFGVRVGDSLNFAAPRFTVNVEDVVECTIDSRTDCTVTKVLIPAPVPPSKVPADA
ncbi:MAG TPA: hypothetical protein VKC90_02060 [Chitinophagaceae bacterium]|nr:hypothetical protein [Chitinophagaceae bacterium]